MDNIPREGLLESSILGGTIVYGVAKAFIRYGADPLAYYRQRESFKHQGKLRPVSIALDLVIGCVKDDEERLEMEQLIASETAYSKAGINILSSITLTLGTILEAMDEFRRVHLTGDVRA